MARNLFSVPIFFIVFRETIEAAIIVSVLLGLVEQIVRESKDSSSDAEATLGVLSQSTVRVFPKNPTFIRSLMLL